MTLYDFSLKHICRILTCATPLLVGGLNSHAAPATPYKEIETTENLPTVSLTREIVYQTLAAELALQRGQTKAGLVTLNHLAETTRDPRFARRALEAAFISNQPELAAKNAALWLQLNPRSEAALTVAILTDVLGERWTQAESLAKRLLEQSTPKTLPENINQLAAQWLSTKHPVAAYPSFSRLIQPYLDQTAAQIALAQLAMRAGEPKIAIEKLEAILKTALPPEEALVLLADWLSHNPEDPQAIITAQQRVQHYLKQHPNSYAAQLTLARLYANAGALETAEQLYTQLANTPSDDPSPLLALGLLQADRKAWDNARNTLLKYLNRSPIDEHSGTMPSGQRIALQALAQIEEAQGRLVMAKNWLLQVRDPSLGLQLNAKVAELEARLGGIDDAITRLDHQAQRYKELGNFNAYETLTRLAISLLIEYKKPAQALVRLENWLDTHPKDVQALYDLAMVTSRLGDRPRTEQTLRKVLELDPEHHQGLNALGYHFAEHDRNLDEAKTLIEKALSQDPSDPFILDSLGWVYFRKGNITRAQDTLQKAWLLKKDAEIAAHLGEVLWVQHEENEAKKLWQHALAIEADNPSLRQTLARFAPHLTYQTQGRFVAQWEMPEKNEKERIQGYFEIRRGSGQTLNATLTGLFGQTLLDVQQTASESILKLRDGRELRGTHLQNLLNELEDLPPVPLDLFTQLFNNSNTKIPGWDIQRAKTSIVLKRIDFGKIIEIRLYPEIGTD
jgi:tetratricopeptide (TPR) repeat protein